MYRKEIYYSWEGEPARRITLSESLVEGEWNVYIEDRDDRTHDYETTDIGIFPSRDAAELSLEERCDILEGQGFVRTRIVVD